MKEIIYTMIMIILLSAGMYIGYQIKHCPHYNACIPEIVTETKDIIVKEYVKTPPSQSDCINYFDDLQLKNEQIEVWKTK